MASSARTTGPDPLGTERPETDPPETDRELAAGQPDRCLRGLVTSYQGFHYRSSEPVRRVVLPEAVVKLVFAFGKPVSTVDAVDPRRVGSMLSVAVPLQTTAMVGSHNGQVHGLAVLLTPLGAHRIFGLPMSEWEQQEFVPIEVLLPSLAGLGERLAECPSWAGRFGLLDEVLTGRLPDALDRSPELERAWGELRRSSGRVSVTELADRTGWSRRHLERKFAEQVGCSPKKVAQVLRLRAALRLHERGLPLAKVADAAGFHDQSHLNRVYREMIGCSPTRATEHRVDWQHTTPTAERY
ncbi:helix-turn-helix domain-containing protein [Kitasatospora sp. MAP5-34]|uniref:AraC family transcriptional regulator n=1 Tax=Kitasatospora sp. MAP5-34 TaxID=3035102 RepID=UPI0024749F54|nr:helix-turn-helix domain-containing protein [Kitasatospora sp. MAP5-34]MDH6577735.1 AraC-like DNA-binding protein [Kitasatospora sp. MAP5-34]